MNSTCAGGTGGFIDTIAGMLDMNAEQLNYCAHGCKNILPIASRCAVFAQADVRPLINQGVSKEDIAGSAFDAVVAQCVGGLACGRPIVGNVAFLGGPLHFLSALRERFIDRLGLDSDHVVGPARGPSVCCARSCAGSMACSAFHPLSNGREDKRNRLEAGSVPASS